MAMEEIQHNQSPWPADPLASSGHRVLANARGQRRALRASPGGPGERPPSARRGGRGGEASPLLGAG